MAQEANPKTNVYVGACSGKADLNIYICKTNSRLLDVSPLRPTRAGGLDENVTETILRTAFTPFGEVKEVNIPLDNATGKHRGFGFVEFFEK